MSERVNAISERVVEERRYIRFPLAYRIEHWVQVFSFTTLAITGLVQRFSEAGISLAVIRLLGGVESVRVIHRIAAVILMVAVVYHIGAVLYRIYVKRYRLSMLPTMDDVRAAIHSIQYFLGRRKTRPLQGRYTFEEKVEYWAFVWGTVIMVFTGFMLWNPIATTRFLPGEFIPAAKTAHGGEALLAVLAIIIWHMYHVHIRQFNRSIFHGTMTEEEMLEEHPLELADIKSGVATRPVDPRQVERRKRAFYAVYGAVGAVLLLGIVAFVTFEDTAIETVPPPEEVAVFVPLTPTPLPTPIPTSTPLPTPTMDPQATEAPGGAEGTGALTWTSGIAGLFEQKCSACHGTATQLGGLNLSSYESALAGGASGPGIVPGNPNESQVVIIQSQGGHPGQFSGEELATIREWIEAGAPEE